MLLLKLLPHQQLIIHHDKYHNFLRRVNILVLGEAEKRWVGIFPVSFPW